MPTVPRADLRPRAPPPPGPAPGTSLLALLPSGSRRQSLTAGALRASTPTEAAGKQPYRPSISQRGAGARAENWGRRGHAAEAGSENPAPGGRP